MNSKVYTTVLIAASSLLAACGGGGGTSGGPPPTPSYTACPNGYTGTAPNCVAPATTTTASGVLVDDPSGNPLASISVKLEPWIGGATPLPSPQTTTAPDGSFSFTAPNGHYLLVIGSNSTSDTTRPTIHDNVTLTGGTQKLTAPNMPAQPTDFRTAVELSGKYRLATIDQTTELPCFNLFNTGRQARSLPITVLDEWLTEDTRDKNAYRLSPTFNVSNQVPSVAQGTVTAGGSHCYADNDFNINPVSNDPRVQWFGGLWVYSPISSSGNDEFPIDPRAYIDPIYPSWP